MEVIFVWLKMDTTQKPKFSFAKWSQSLANYGQSLFHDQSPMRIQNSWPDRTRLVVYQIFWLLHFDGRDWLGKESQWKLPKIGASRENPSSVNKAAVYGDRPAYVNERKNGVGSTDESFSAALLSGRPFVLLDNFRGKINLTSLESFLTADGKFDCRALRTNGSVDPENYFLGMTSNGAEMTKDLANRSCFVRIRKRPDGYEFRDYGDQEFIDYIRSITKFSFGNIPIFSPNERPTKDKRDESLF